MVVSLNYSESYMADINMQFLHTPIYCEGARIHHCVDSHLLICLDDQDIIRRILGEDSLSKATKLYGSVGSLILLMLIVSLSPVSINRSPIAIESVMVIANEPHGPIVIDGDANFSATADAEGWSGDGSTQDPYIIENYDITMGPTPEASINITNTRVSFVVQGCSLIGPAATPSYGIHLENSTNGRIVNNMITNFATGLNVSAGSTNTIVTGNNISYNSYGIWWEQSDNFEINENHCSHNFFTGVYISNSDDGTISRNNCSGNGLNGIHSLSSTYNTLSENICHGNTNAGFRLQVTDWSTFENNTSSENGVGIWSTASVSNPIHWNIFVNNTSNIFDDGTNLLWDYNYWSDYTGSDANSDGFGDTPYTFGWEDNYPLMYLPFPVEWAQLITDQYVEFGEYFDYNIAINCPAPYTVCVNDTTNFWTGMPTIAASTTLDIGDYPILVNVTNIYGYYTEAIFTVFVRDTTPPLITGPDDFSFTVGEESQMIIWEAQDLSPLSYVVLRNGFELSSDSLTQNSIHYSMILENYPAGIFNYTMVVTDSSGNVASDEVMVTILPTPLIEVVLRWLVVGIIPLAAVIIIVIIFRKRRSIKS